jgi:hypothetical protein
MMMGAMTLYVIARNNRSRRGSLAGYGKMYSSALNVNQRSSDDSVARGRHPAADLQVALERTRQQQQSKVRKLAAVHENRNATREMQKRGFAVQTNRARVDRREGALTQHPAPESLRERCERKER